MLEKEQKNKAIYYEMALYQWQGQKDLVSPAGSVGASALRAEVSTGDPHPSARGFGAKSTLSVKPRVEIHSLKIHIITALSGFESAVTFCLLNF